MLKLQMIPPPKEEVDMREFYVPKEDKLKGGFTISRIPRFVNNYRNFDITSQPGIKTDYGMKKSIEPVFKNQ
jgi:hypothetical protein